MTERPECGVAWSISTHGEFTGVSCSGMTSEPPGWELGKALLWMVLIRTWVRKQILVAVTIHIH